MESSDREFDLEAYWGTRSGTLMHGTITVCAPSVEDAITWAFSNHLKPRDQTDHYPACARAEYFVGHYDVEEIGM